MSKFQDPEYLLNEQYHTASNLNARIRLHVEFSTNEYGWFPWLFDHYDFPADARILELGCGPGDLWLENKDRIPAGWDITVSDFSPGMVDKARQKLAEVQHPITIQKIDAQSIPYPGETFDIVIANHCLYHFPDRGKALAEIQRVLKEGGRFLTTTIGARHLQEMAELVTRFSPTIEDVFSHDENPFTLENGKAQLSKWFSDVTLRRYPDSLRVTDAEALADFIQSTVRFGLRADQRQALVQFIGAEMALNEGVIQISKDSGVFEGWKVSSQKKRE